MSRTEIYRLGNDPCLLGETSNSHRSAMYVWNDVAVRYFGLDRFPLSAYSAPDAIEWKIWNAFKHHKMREHEAIVLISTLDNMTMRATDIMEVHYAFNMYGAEHPGSSFIEQAEILRAADLKADDLVAWNQTSVNGFWGQEWDEDTDSCFWYDPATRDKHYDLMNYLRDGAL